MAQPKKRPAIDKRIMTDAQAKKQERINQMSAELGVAQDQEWRAIDAAIAASVYGMLLDADEAFVEAFFTRILDAATTANARKIRRHPSCPAHLVATDVVESGKGATPAAKPSNPPTDA